MSASIMPNSMPDSTMVNTAMPDSMMINTAMPDTPTKGAAVEDSSIVKPTAVLDNVFLGDVGYGFNWAGFSHKNSANTAGYALLQYVNGIYTLINKKSGGGYIGFRVDNADKMMINDSGWVGIGTTTPNRQLHVQGTEIHCGGGGAGFSFGNRETTAFVQGPANGERWVWYSTGGVARLWSGGDKVFVNTSGVVSAFGFSIASSRELKDNIAELSGQEALETLENLNPVKYNYKADNENNQHIGFIAEDVPELVATADRKGISSMDIVAVLTKALQEQQKTIASLAQKVQRLEAQSA